MLHFFEKLLLEFSWSASAKSAGAGLGYILVGLVGKILFNRIPFFRARTM